MSLAAKKIIAAALLPPTLFLIVLALALILLFFTKKQRLGRMLALASLLGILALSLPSGASFLLNPLEKRYPPLSLEKATGARYIVVLTAASYKSASEKHDVDATSLARVQETLRLHRYLSDAQVIVSGDAPSAAAMKHSLQELGIDKAKISIDGVPLDTANSLKRLKKTLGGEKFVLVSSAFHIPRVMLLCRQQGLSPLPAPCSYSAHPEFIIPTQRFLPEAKHLARSALAIKEYYGIAYYWLLGSA